MVVKTRAFGEIDVDEEKIITFPNGIVGFPELQKFTLLYDLEKGQSVGVKWLQSLDEPEFALPVMDPLLVKPDYNPSVEDELLKPIGELKDEYLLVQVAMNVPSDLTRMTVNLQAPLIINAETKKGCQVILESGEYPIRFAIYDILKDNKKKTEE
ncbi:MAG: flagellar assembly protein FliW [Lachnospiraceae bacterium]|nr:flagellar assembly protein FliW [Lachnospiraceae bacterium]